MTKQAFILLASIWVSVGCQPNDAPSESAPPIKKTEISGTALNQTKTLVAIDSASVQHALDTILADFRQVIVLLVDEKAAAKSPAELVSTAQALYHHSIAEQAALADQFQQWFSSAHADRIRASEQMLEFIESGSDLFDADRLAFRDFLQQLQKIVAQDSSLPAIKLHRRIKEDLQALDEIEGNYNKELSVIFNRLDTRAIALKREKWQDYIDRLKRIYNKAAILKAKGIILPTVTASAPTSGTAIYGYDLPAKTLVLSFDDGPHPIYTAEISAILKQYQIPGLFFTVGKNLGSVDAEGKAKVSERGKIAEQLREDGFVLGNHSYSHAVLAKTTGDSLKTEVEATEHLLNLIERQQSKLFRFPYGADSEEGNTLLSQYQLQSVKWNIDSMDWADPVPDSIADRVLNLVQQEGHGIVLFHDINQRTVKALPKILDQLLANDYRFASWDGAKFVAPERSPQQEKAAVTSEYGDSWAVVIGINAYQHWPTLQYAVSDAEAVRNTLIDAYGFKADHIFSLTNEQATRNDILSVFHDKLVHGGIKKDDRLLVFYAGHGATKHLSSGRDLGYIIPVDSGTDSFASDAIAMSDIQNIAEAMLAKHVLFVMDACYSGLGLTRGANSGYLKENARRLGRQMLTAGGADQMVSDSGPNGHSVFTWTVLQALNGKGDLNGDGLITATELAAYVAPVVSNLAPQTPAFGSLPGSEGGEFVFALHTSDEFIAADTEQLSKEAIAINVKMDAVQQKVESKPIKVVNLQGESQTLKINKPANINIKQQAQRLNDKGLQYYREQRYDEAEEQFTEALKLRPDFALASNNLSYIFFKQKKYSEALVWINKTLAIDPSRAVAYWNLGDIQSALDHKAEAIKAFETYLALVPTGKGAEHATAELVRLRSQ